MIRRLFLTAAVVFSLACQPLSLTAQDDTSPFAQAAKRPGGLHDLLAPAKRAPLPPRAEREKVLAQVRKVFGSPDDSKRRAALVKELIKAGREDEKPANRYALLCHAGELAIEGADLALASEAADLFSEYFDIDVLAIKASLLERLFGKVAHKELLTAAARHFDEALAADHFEAAARIGRVGYRAAVAAKDKQQIASMRRSAARVKDRRAAFDALKSAIATLKEKPDDAPANLQVGEYLCFVRGDWERGLPLLVKGGHAIVKQEAAASRDPAAQKEVGDAWWNLAETKTGRTQTHIKARAATWYQRVLPKLAGLSKRRVQRRLEALLPQIESVASSEKKKAAASRSVYLDDMKELESVVGYGKLGKHGSQGYKNQNVIFRGQTPRHALSTHGKQKGAAYVTYALAGEFRAFQAIVGVVDTGGGQPRSPLTFKVYGDGKLLWESKPVQRRSVAQQCKVNITGVRILRLQVDCPGRNNHSRAVWINPQVIARATTRKSRQKRPQRK